MFEPVSFHPLHDIEAQIENATSPIMLEVRNFQEVTTVEERNQNILVFSFSVLNSDSINSSLDLFTNDSFNRDIIQLQWETVNGSRGLIAVMPERDDLHKVQGAMRYRFTVNTTDLGEGPLLLTLSFRLRCIQSCATGCSRFVSFRFREYYQQRCTCTQWQYEGESKTILVSAKQGEATGNVHSI